MPLHQEDAGVVRSIEGLEGLEGQQVARVGDVLPPLLGA
jgi:hypothetical protein